MREATDLLSRFFAEKAISGDPITPEETEWIQHLLTPSQSEPSQHLFDDSQSVVFQGDTEPNCFLSQSTFGFSQPSAYDSQEVLRKYQHYYSASQEMQPSQLSRKKPQSTPKPLLASLDSQRVLTPILETFKSKSLPLQKEALPNKDATQDVKGGRTAAREAQPGLTGVANAIIQILGDSGKTATPTVSKPAMINPTNPTPITPAIITPAVITITPAVTTSAFPMTPSPTAVVRPFVVDTPNDSEAFPKRIRTAEPEKPSPVKSKEDVSQPSLPIPDPQQSASLPTEPSLPVFEFHSPSFGATQSDNNSLRREARRCSSSELPGFVF